MARVSSAPQDAAKSAPLVPKPESASLYLVPSQILRTKGNDFARPGPKPPDEQKSIEALARDLRNIGQIVPLVVGEPDIAGLYPLIDGKRRLDAAELLTQESGVDFPLQCVIRSGVQDDYLQAAIHANIRRRGLTALQLAYLIKELRAMHGWTGTAEVAVYLGVSRAQVSQHDKLLKRPDGMAESAYQDLLGLLQVGRAGAETAFYTLTHVEPSVAGQVLDRAQIIAEAEREQKSALTHVKEESTRPVKRQTAPRADKTESESSKSTRSVVLLAKRVFDELSESYSADKIPDGKMRKPVKTDGYGLLVSTGSAGGTNEGSIECYRVLTSGDYAGPEVKPAVTYNEKISGDGGESARNDPNGFYHGMRINHGGAAYVLFGPPLYFGLRKSAEAEPVAEPQQPKPKAKVEKKHVRQAAQESRAIKEQTQRTIPELRALFEKLRAPSYPDIMRGFISVLAGQWWTGAEPDSTVITRWTQIATLVEESLERSHKRGPAKHPYGPRKKRTPSLEEKKKLYSGSHR
jgi:ParB-like chromosome segregation protein Spo0J